MQAISADAGPGGVDAPLGQPSFLRFIHLNSFHKREPVRGRLVFLVLHGGVAEQRLLVG